ncbi:hypothetical protein KP509_26G013600 [Ceratopteris richardii]|uniref:Cyanobacterial aminoacyl-tRNA synthetase CAAD domain-containing protein n=1 Tax=Ceratopteris richardii TaxID=49495 RepID=A0A8T2RIJ9_CERRI|nr:hypothetical protein KP509_26G013600 [Ceratopteris richardii]
MAGFSLNLESFLPGSVRWTPLSVRATTSTEQASTSTATTSIPSSSTTEETTVQAEDLVADLKAKWDAIENKTNVFIYGGGALAALWFSTTILGAVNSVPLLPKLLELVGLGYSFWFVYRYLLFKENRKELTKEIEQLKAKLTE